MWEVFTLGRYNRFFCSKDIFSLLGNFPYPCISSRDLLLHLRKGNRLSRPGNCCKELFVSNL